MYQPWIFGAMMAAGTGLVVVAVTRPPSDTSDAAALEPPPSAVYVVPPLEPTTVAEPADTAPVLEMAPVVIDARQYRRPSTAATTPPKPAAAEHPCSTWRELGPTHVVAGKPSGELQVRDLCL